MAIFNKYFSEKSIPEIFILGIVIILLIIKPKIIPIAIEPMTINSDNIKANTDIITTKQNPGNIFLILFILFTT